MRRSSLLLVIILAIASTVPLYNLPKVYGVQSSLAATTTSPPQGLVCFSMKASSCPPSPVQFSAPLGGTFTAYVVIQGSEAFNGFNIWFQYPYGVLNATSVSLQSSVLPGVSVQFECVNGKGSPSCGEWAWNSCALRDGEPDDSADYGIAVQCLLQGDRVGGWRAWLLLRHLALWTLA